MENMIAKIAKNDEFKTVGVRVCANDKEVVVRGCVIDPNFYYVKNVRLDVETYTEIIKLDAEIKALEMAEHSFFNAFKESTLKALDKAAKETKDESLLSFNMSIYREPRKEKEARLNAILENLK